MPHFWPTPRQDLPKELIESHYPNSRDFPDYFTNAGYIRFTPQVECLVLPGAQRSLIQQLLAVSKQAYDTNRCESLGLYAEVAKQLLYMYAARCTCNQPLACNMSSTCVPRTSPCIWHYTHW
jgi:hypothetical protein